MSEKFVAYVSPARIETEKGRADTICTAGTIEEVRNYLDEGNQVNIPDQPDKMYDEPTQIETAIGKGVWQFYHQLKSYYEVAYATDIIPRSFISSFFQTQLLKHAEENYAVVEEYNGRAIYGLHDYDAIYVNRAIEKWNAIEAGFNKFPESILLSLVATYDSAFADFCKVILKSRPERYEGSDRQYSVADILKLSSLDQIVDKVVEDEIEQLMNKSHSEQIRFFEKSFNISIQGEYERWPDFIEVFERRNLAAHGSLVVNERYISNCKSAGKKNLPNFGDKLEVDGEYLESAIDTLVEFGILLAIAAWQKQEISSIKDSFGAIVEVGYSLLTDYHPSVAVNILEYGLKVKSKGADEDKIKMMIVNLAIAYKACDRKKDCDVLIESTDWSVCSPVFKLCTAAILEKVDDAIAVLEAAKVTDGISSVEIREWPAFRWIRKNDDFKEACLRVFGEHITPLKKLAATEEISSDSSTPSEVVDKDMG